MIYARVDNVTREILEYPVDPRTVRDWCKNNNLSVGTDLDSVDLTSQGWYQVAYVPPPPLMTPGYSVVLDTPQWQGDTLVRTFREVPRLQETTDQLWEKVRERRNQLLEESDWTELPSVRAQRPAEWLQSWRDYRNQLRNITSAPDPEMVEWPTPPESE